MNRNLKSLLSALAGMFVMLVSTAAFASNGAGDNEFTMKAFIAIAAGLGIGIAAFGGALALALGYQLQALPTPMT